MYIIEVAIRTAWVPTRVPTSEAYSSDVESRIVKLLGIIVSQLLFVPNSDPGSNIENRDLLGHITRP